MSIKTFEFAMFSRGRADLFNPRNDAELVVSRFKIGWIVLRFSLAKLQQFKVSVIFHCKNAHYGKVFYRKLIYCVRAELLEISLTHRERAVTM